MALVQLLFRFDRSGLRPVGALLRLLGMAVAVLVGGFFGGYGGAVLAGVGALYSGIASFGGVHKARLKRMLAATLAAAVATLIGCFVQPSDAATVLIVTVGIFGLSLFAAAGPDAAQVSLLATGTLIVFSGLHGANVQPLGNAALVLGGGLAQAAVLMLFHPISPVAAERRAVERVYLGLRDYTAAQAAGRKQPLPNVTAHAEARDLLRAGFAYGTRPELQELWQELELADALRGGFAGLDRAGAPGEVWQVIGAWLEAATDEVSRGKPLDRRLPPIEADAEVAVWLRRIRRTIEAEEAGRLPTAVPTPGSWVTALRKVETLRSLALGHALRYALAIGITTLGYRVLHIDHGYWAPLSLAFSLKADFASTLTRGLGRTVGTAIGVLMATSFVGLLTPSHNMLMVAMLASVWVAFTWLNAWYVGYSTMLAFYVVVSVTASGPPVTTVGMERLWATAAGSAIAFVAAILWPQWEAGKVKQSLAVAFAAQAQYADAVTQRAESEALGIARLQARTARLEAERIVAAAGFEPSWSRRRHLEGAGAALARLAENAARILAAHIAVLDPQGEVPVEELRRLAAENRGNAADLMG